MRQRCGWGRRQTLLAPPDVAKRRPQRFFVAFVAFAGAPAALETLADAEALVAEAFVAEAFVATAFVAAAFAAAAFVATALVGAALVGEGRVLAEDAAAPAFFAAEALLLVLSAALKAAAGLNATDFDAGTFTVAWVWGLRAVRGPRDLGSNEPNPKIDTRFPAFTSPIMAAATASTAASDCFLSRPVEVWTAWASSVLFTATSR